MSQVYILLGYPKSKQHKKQCSILSLDYHQNKLSKVCKGQKTLIISVDKFTRLLVQEHPVQESPHSLED